MRGVKELIEIKREKIHFILGNSLSLYKNFPENV